MFNCLQAVKYGRKKGIFVIIGCEAYICDDLTVKTKDNQIARFNRTYHILLLAKNIVGYKNLCHLITIAYRDGFYGYPRIDHKTLYQYRDGLICLTACTKGEIPSYILDLAEINANPELYVPEDFWAAEKRLNDKINWYKDTFGNDLYFELMPGPLIENQIKTQKLIELSKIHNVKLVATNDVHYDLKENANWHDILLACNTGTTMQDPNRMRYGEYLKDESPRFNTGEQYYWCEEKLKNGKFVYHNSSVDPYNMDIGDGNTYTFKLHDYYYMISEDEIRNNPLIPDEAVNNTMEIADKCNMAGAGYSEIKFEPASKMPSYESYRLTKDPIEQIDKICKSNWERKLSHIRLLEHSIYGERYEYELGVISKMGFGDYFLILWDIVSWAKRQGIYVGPGRGCLTGNTKVLTNVGYINLDEIRIGDVVYTHTGMKRKVLSTMKYPTNHEDLIRISTRHSFNPISLTKDHLVFGAKIIETNRHKNAKYNNLKSVNKLKRFRSVGEPTWIRAENLSVNDLVFTPWIHRETMEFNKIDLADYNYEDLEVSDSVVFQKIPKDNKLTIRTITKETGVSRTFLKRFIKNKKECPFSRSYDAIKKVNDYLKPYNLDINKWAEIDNNNYININRFIEVDEDFVYFIGRWIGDGWINYNGNGSYKWGMAFHGEDNNGIEKIGNYLNYLGFNYTLTKHKSKNLIQMHVYGRLLYDLFSNLFPEYRKTSRSKYIGQFKYLHDDLLKTLLLGLHDSNGHCSKVSSKTNKGYREYIDSASLRLILEIKQCLLFLKIPSAITIRKPFRSGKYNCKESYKISFKGLKLSKSKSKLINEYGYYSRIISIEPCNSDYVYDITVEEDSSYLTSNFAVHNSAGGSLVVYLLDITDVDPIQWSLYFERFLNPDRISMPDIDIDFEQGRRDEVVNYIIDRFGHDKVSQIITFAKLKAKSVILQAGAVLGVPFAERQKITGSIESLVEASTTVADLYENNTNLYNMIKSYPHYGEMWVQLIEKLEMIPKSAGQHAAGTIISPNPIADEVPIFYRNNEPAAMFDMNLLEDIGYVKFDILGVKTLDHIRVTVEFIKENRGIEINPWRLPLDDDKALKIYTSGKLTGVFQCKYQGFRKLAQRLDPGEFMHVVDLMCLYRPGPLKEGMTNDYIERRHGKEVESKFHPDVQEILKPTFGIMLYQEQIMEVSRKIFGWTFSKADELRKAIGKKKLDLMNKIKEEVLRDADAGKTPYPKDIVENTFTLIEPSARYSWNKAHGVEYGLISYVTAWLKAHYPVEFYAALLYTEIGNSDELASILRDVRQEGIDLIPPHINRSKANFSVNNNTIIFGFSSIKGIGKIADLIMTERVNGEFKGFVDFCNRMPPNICNKSVKKALIHAGAFDFDNYTRKTLVESIDYITKITKTKTKTVAGQKIKYTEKAPDNLTDITITEMVPSPTDPTKKVKREKKFESLDEYNEAELLKHEKDVLGIQVSGHMLDKYEFVRDIVRETMFNTITEILELPQDWVTWTLCTISHIRKHIDKRGGEMAFINLSDQLSSIDCICFSSEFSTLKARMALNTPLLARITINIRDNQKNGIISDIYRLDAAIPIRHIDFKKPYSQMDILAISSIFGDDPMTISNTSIYFHNAKALSSDDLRKLSTISSGPEVFK